MRLRQILGTYIIYLPRGISGSIGWTHYWRHAGSYLPRWVLVFLALSDYYELTRDTATCAVGGGLKNDHSDRPNRKILFIVGVHSLLLN